MRICSEPRKLFLLVAIVIASFTDAQGPTTCFTDEPFDANDRFRDEDGIFFDISVPNNVTVDGVFIKGFTFEISDREDPVNELFQVWATQTPSSYVGKERNPALWSLQTELRITAVATEFVNVDLGGLGAFVPSGATRGFYLTFRRIEAMKYFDTSRTGFDDPLGFVSVSEGAASGYGFAGGRPGLFRERDFQGSVCYILADTAVDENEILWQSEQVGPSVESTPAIGPDGTIYFVGEPHLYAYTPDGVRLWRTNVNARDFVSPSVSADGQTVYIGGHSGLFALSASTGAVIWESDLPKLYSVPTISPDGSRVYIGAGSEQFASDLFFAVNAENGDLMWQYELTRTPLGFRGFLGGAIATVDEATGDTVVYVASQHGYLVAIRDFGDNTFDELWAAQIGAEMRMPPAFADGFLFVSESEFGDVHKVDASNGQEVTSGNWPVHVNSLNATVGEVFANLVVSRDGVLYANSEDTRLYAIDTASGDILWNNVQFEWWGSDPLIRADGMIIVMSEIGGGARMTAIRDYGTFGEIEWQSDELFSGLNENESNVAIGPNGQLYVLAGQQSPLTLFALRGRAGVGLDETALWPKYMNNIANGGQF